MFIYVCWKRQRERERERERENVSRGGPEREGERIPSRLCTVNAEANTGLEPTNNEIMTWAERDQELDAQPTEPPRHPYFFFIFVSLIYFYFESESTTVGRAERIPSRLHDDSTEPHAGIKPTNCEIMTWAKISCLTDWTTQAPLSSILLCLKFSNNFPLPNG